VNSTEEDQWWIAAKIWSTSAFNGFMSAFTKLVYNGKVKVQERRWQIFGLYGLGKVLILSSSVFPFSYNIVISAREIVSRSELRVSLSEQRMQRHSFPVDLYQSAIFLRIILILRISSSFRFKNLIWIWSLLVRLSVDKLPVLMYSILAASRRA